MDNCSAVTCNVTITVPKDMIAPIFVYYQLDNFYRRNRNFYKSKSVEQLRGNNNPDISSCDNYVSNKDLGRFIH